ncbi:hypothetical protein F5146DRAFT_1070154 [Armillaria mellea]|nr:hypothetical protein F5146DRAFT_1070154 [Armillaria mellea]
MMASAAALGCCDGVAVVARVSVVVTMMAPAAALGCCDGVVAVTRVSVVVTMMAPAAALGVTTTTPAAALGCCDGLVACYSCSGRGIGDGSCCSPQMLRCLLVVVMTLAPAPVILHKSL